MEFDPSFAENFPYLYGISPKNSYNTSEIPTMVHMNPSPFVSHHPSDNTASLYQNYYHHFHQHPLKGTNHYSSFSMECPSSTTPFCMIPTPSLGNSDKIAHINGSTTDFVSASYPMAFSPKSSKIDVMECYLNNGKSYLDFANENPLQYSTISESHVSTSLSPLLVYDAHASMVVPDLQDVVSPFTGIGNNLRDVNLSLDVGDQKKQRRVEKKNNECQHTDTNVTKGQWTEDEDRYINPFKNRELIELVNQYGDKKWSQVAKFIDGRIGKQCRERWKNHLRPNIKKNPWSEEEEKMLIETHKEVGNKWAEIARRLPGRTENSIKNLWNATKRRLDVKRKQNRRSLNGKLLQMYIKEVIDAEGDENKMKQPMRMINIGSKQDHKNESYHGIARARYESSEGDINSEAWATQENEVNGYMPMAFNSNEMVNLSGKTLCGWNGDSSQGSNEERLIL